MSNIDSIWKKEGDEWKKMAVNSSVPGVGYIYETLSTTETITTLAERYGGTWEAMPDRIEDDWHTINVTLTNTSGVAYNNLSCKARYDGKDFIRINFKVCFPTSFYVDATNEKMIWQDIKFNGVSYNTWTGGNAGFPLMYYDMDNEVRYAAVYISGSDKLWFGVNFAANRRGWALGELVVPKNSYLTPDRTIKRFKRVS